MPAGASSDKGARGIGRLAGLRRRPSSRPAEVDPAVEAPAGSPPGASGPAAKIAGKGRPTPKRREAQKRRTGPAAPPPANRKEAARRQRESARERRDLMREAMRKGDERYLPPRDAGPARRLVRDLVDSRRSALTYFLAFGLVLIALSLIRSATVQAIVLLVWLAVIVLMVGDGVRLGLLIRRRLHERFPAGVEGRMRGHVTYGIVRATQVRRLRLPPPKVQIGDRV